MIFYSIIVIVLLGLIVRSFIKGTFWSSNLSSGLGGAIVGIILAAIVIGLVIMVVPNFGMLLMGLVLILFPMGAIIGAILFISIGTLKRKKSRAIAPSSEGSTHSIGPASRLETAQPVVSTSQFTTIKRPVFVWVITIVIALIILGLISSLFHFGMDFPSIVKYSILLLSQIIFVILFFNLRKDSLKWLYISFGLMIVSNVVLMQWISATIMALLGSVIWYYISQNKVNNQPVFKSADTKYSDPETYFGYKPGSIVERSAAYITEKIIIIILLQVILGADFYNLNIGWEDGSYFTTPFIVLGKLLGGSALIGAIFYPLWSGNAGHKLFGLKVISSIDGSDFNSVKSGAGRELLKALMTLILFPVVWLFVDDKKQNLYDKRVNTYVVKQHEAISKQGFALRAALLVAMLLLALLQYYS